MACKRVVWLLLLLPHGAAETFGRIIDTEHMPLDTNAEYMAAPVDASKLTKEAHLREQTQAALNLGEPSCHTIKGRQVCLPNAVQRQAAKQVRDLGFVQNLAFAHSTKAAGSTVDLVLWNTAHRLNTSVFIRPKVWSKVKRLQGVNASTGGRFWLSTEEPRSLWIHQVTPGTFEFLMLRHPLERCQSYFNFRLGDGRTRFAYMQNMNFTEWLESTLHLTEDRRSRQSCTDFYFRQLRGERDATLAHVRAEIRSHYLLVGLADRMLESVYMLARLAGWPTDGLLKHFVSANVNTHHKDKEAILASTERWFEQHNPNDMALWEEALEGWHATYAMFLKRDGKAFRAFLADAGLPVRSRYPFTLLGRY